MASNRRKKTIDTGFFLALGLSVVTAIGLGAGLLHAGQVLMCYGMDTCLALAAGIVLAVIREKGPSLEWWAVVTTAPLLLLAFLLGLVLLFLPVPTEDGNFELASQLDVGGVVLVAYVFGSNLWILVDGRRNFRSRWNWLGRNLLFGSWIPWLVVGFVTKVGLLPAALLFEAIRPLVYVMMKQGHFPDGEGLDDQNQDGIEPERPPWQRQAPRLPSEASQPLRELLPEAPTTPEKRKQWSVLRWPKLRRKP
ncbi:MAG: hypothetical protein IPK87_12200 [Planctomycetes bacterium]|nr:hypothetical protein [Planctomycetota bacterium]